MGIESLRRVHGLAAGDWKVDEAEGEGHKPSVATALNVEEVAWGIFVPGGGLCTWHPHRYSMEHHGLQRSDWERRPGGRHAEVRLTDMLYKADTLSIMASYITSAPNQGKPSTRTATGTLPIGTRGGTVDEA